MLFVFFGLCSAVVLVECLAIEFYTASLMRRSLFILSLASVSVSPTFAAVGDVVTIDAKNPYYIEGVIDTTPTNSAITSVDRELSSRFYDSNKGGPWTRPYSDGTEGDSLMCWSHASTNAIQYWQDVYGVFYRDSGNMAATKTSTPRALYNGYYASNPAEGHDTEVWYGATVPNERRMDIARAFYAGWSNSGGKFRDGVDWYFRWDATTAKDGPGGYYSEYFGNYNGSTPAYVSTEITNDMGGLKSSLLTALGLEQQADGSYVQVQEGLLAGLSITRDVYSNGQWLTYGHAINCVGVNLDNNGNLVSILITNGDDGISQMQQIYLASDPTDSGKIKIYRDAACSTLWQAGNEWYVTDVSYINTPEVLQNMLSEYRDTSEAAVWSGTSSEWSTQVDVVDSEIADASTGWDVYVDGSTGKEIAEQHHDYYHGYALEGRNVLFGDHAAEGNRTVTINGKVSAGHIEVAAAGYQFKKGTDGAIAAGADMTVRSGASLDSEVALNLGDLELEQGALLSSTETITVTGAFITTLQEMSTFALRDAIVPSASVDADLDLRMATSITLNTAVDMNGHNLFLSEVTPITISLSEVDGSILFFANVGTLSVLTIEGITEVITTGTDLTQYFTITSTDGTDLSGYSLVYADGALAMSIVPEPATAALSLLALAALAARRRRK